MPVVRGCCHPTTGYCQHAVPPHLTVWLPVVTETTATSHATATSYHRVAACSDRARGIMPTPRPPELSTPHIWALHILRHMLLPAPHPAPPSTHRAVTYPATCYSHMPQHHLPVSTTSSPGEGPADTPAPPQTATCRCCRIIIISSHAHSPLTALSQPPTSP